MIFNWPNQNIHDWWFVKRRGSNHLSVPQNMTAVGEPNPSGSRAVLFHFGCRPLRKLLSQCVGDQRLQLESHPNSSYIVKKLVLVKRTLKHACKVISYIAMIIVAACSSINIVCQCVVWVLHYWLSIATT